MPADPTYIADWYGRLLSSRANWDNVWRDLADYLTPNKSGIISQRTQGTKTTDKIFDGTGMRSLKRLSANLHGSMTSSSIKWFTLRMRDENLNRLKNVAVWLEDCVNRMLNAFNQSNFGSEGQELYVDMGAFGTGSLFVEENEPTEDGKFGGLRFTALPIGSYVIDEDPYGNVNTIMRCIKMTPKNIVTRFPEAVLPDKIKEDAEKNKVDLLEVIHAIYPREGGVSTLDADAKKLKYASVYILFSKKILLSESGFHEFPAPTPRWSKMSGEAWGRGPGHEAIPDVKTLNRAVELTLKAWAKAIDPPLLAENDGITGGVIRLNPAGITYVRDSEKSLRPLALGSRWDVIKLETEDLKQAIREAFFVDQLSLKDSPQMTAEEVRARIEQMQKMLGPTLGRIESEFLNPLIQRVFNLMFRANALLPAPAEIIQAMGTNSGDIDVEYTGPLAKNQRIGEVYAIQKAYEVAFSIAQSKAGLPSVDDVFDSDEALRHAALTLGVPEKVIRDARTVMQIRQDRAEEMAQQAQVEQDRVSAGTVKDLATAREKIGYRPGIQAPDEETAALLAAGGGA